ncbi:MAG: hypothetical protein HZA78_07250 [Candidatus Schekmanbacteria bacterium]|nr:hypothetical protein [Candidatus Schekmanbacteria bacterium]
MVRQLVYIPIIHTQADMGALKGPIERVTVQKLGADGWQRRIQAINQVWERIEREIAGLALDYPKVKLYQDGLPLCDQVFDIVKNLAGKGSRNHQLLLKLQEKGATIVGSESPELLLEEYQRIKHMLDVENYEQIVQKEEQQKELGQALLKKRDRFIAGRINNTLQIGETGLLFIGMLHSLNGSLADDIEIINLLNFESPNPDKPEPKKIS